MNDLKDTQAKATASLMEQVQIRPWTMFGTSIAVGLLLGHFMARREEDSQYYNHDQHDASHGLAKFTGLFDDELKELKGVAVGAILGAFRDLAKDAVPSVVSDKVGEVIDSVTNKLGGEPVKERVVGSSTN